MLVIPILEKLMQDNHHKFETSLGYRVRLCHKKKQRGSLGNKVQVYNLKNKTKISRIRHQEIEMERRYWPSAEL